MIKAERSENLADAGDAAAEFEGEIRDLIRSRDVTFLRAPGKSAGDVNNLNSLLQRVAGSSTGEIDNLIMQLQDMRDFLQTEGDRVQREIAEYAETSHKARTHVERMTDHLAEWRDAIATPPSVAPAE
jgi:hypothetical protein